MAFCGPPSESHLQVKKRKKGGPHKEQADTLKCLNFLGKFQRKLQRKSHLLSQFSIPIASGFSFLRGSQATPGQRGGKTRALCFSWPFLPLGKGFGYGQGKKALQGGPRRGHPRSSLREKRAACKVSRFFPL